MLDLNANRRETQRPKIKNIHAVVDDIKQVIEYIDGQTGDLSEIPEGYLVSAIKGLTKAINDLKETVDAHVEVINVNE